MIENLFPTVLAHCGIDKNTQRKRASIKPASPVTTSIHRFSMKLQMPKGPTSVLMAQTLDPFRFEAFSSEVSAGLLHPPNRNTHYSDYSTLSEKRFHPTSSSLCLAKFLVRADSRHDASCSPLEVTASKGQCTVWKNSDCNLLATPLSEESTKARCLFTVFRVAFLRSPCFFRLQELRSLHQRLGHRLAWLLGDAKEKPSGTEVHQNK